MPSYSIIEIEIQINIITITPVAMSIERIISSIIGFPMTEINEHIAKNFSATNEIQKDVEIFYNNLINEKRPCSNPSILIVSGIPCSGKSHFIKKNRASYYNYCVLKFDRVMESLTIYQKALIDEGAQNAFSKYEFVARVFGYAILCRLLHGH